MKKLITLTVLMLGFLGFGQCKIKSEYDKFNKSTLYITEVNNIIKGGRGFQYFLMKNCEESKCAYAIGIIGAMDGCRTDKSYVQFLTDKGDVIQLSYTSDIDCGNSTPYFYADEEKIKAIQTANITDIRIVYENSLDIELTDKHKAKLKQVLNCLIEAKSENP